MAFHTCRSAYAQLAWRTLTTRKKTKTGIKHAKMPKEMKTSIRHPCEGAEIGKGGQKQIGSDVTSADLRITGGRGVLGDWEKKKKKAWAAAASLTVQLQGGNEKNEKVVQGKSGYWEGWKKKSKKKKKCANRIPET